MTAGKHSTQQAWMPQRSEATGHGVSGAQAQIVLKEIIPGARLIEYALDLLNLVIPESNTFNIVEKFSKMPFKP